MKDYAEQFYKSKTWQKCRASYVRSQGGLCELCRKRGLIVPGNTVHHIIHLTPENIGRPEITLNFDNLQLLCRDCHAEIHSHGVRRWVIGQNGEVIALEDGAES